MCWTKKFELAVTTTAEQAQKKLFADPAKRISVGIIPSDLCIGPAKILVGPKELFPDQVRFVCNVSPSLTVGQNRQQLREFFAGKPVFPVNLYLPDRGAIKVDSLRKELLSFNDVIEVDEMIKSFLDVYHFQIISL